MAHARMSVPRREVDAGEMPDDVACPVARPGGSAGAGVPGRRTVTIQGRGSERYNAATERRRPTRRPYERTGFRPDRAAMWAVLLGLLLLLAAATSSHAAVVSFHTASSGFHAAIAGVHTGVISLRPTP